MLWPGSTGLPNRSLDAFDLERYHTVRSVIARSTSPRVHLTHTRRFDNECYEVKEHYLPISARTRKMTVVQGICVYSTALNSMRTC